MWGFGSGNEDVDEIMADMAGARPAEVSSPSDEAASDPSSAEDHPEALTGVWADFGCGRHCPGPGSDSRGLDPGDTP